MYSTDTRHYSEIVKVKDGQYSLFEGLTIVCPLLVEPDSNRKCDDPLDFPLNDFLLDTNQFGGHQTDYRFLPDSSYHMTVMNLWTRRCFYSANDYNNYNQKALGQLTALKEYLNPLEGFSLMANEVEISDNITVILNSSNDIIARIQGKIEQLGQGLEMRRPTCLHMTLAYSVNEIKTESIIPIDTILHFGSPRLCQFRDMTKFTEI